MDNPHGPRKSYWITLKLPPLVVSFSRNPIGLVGVIFGGCSPWTATYFTIFSRED
jgi:hypothetical protein